MNTLIHEAEPCAIAARCTDDELIVQLVDGRTLAVPLVWFPRLAEASPQARNQIEMMGGGEGLHWPVVDEDLSVAGLLLGRPSIEYDRPRPAN
jgi:hypothetical protein